MQPTELLFLTILGTCMKSLAMLKTKIICRTLFLGLVVLVPFTTSVAQNHVIDSIKAVLKTPLSDSAKIETLCDLSWEYRVAGYTHEALDTGKVALHKAEKITFRIGLIRANIYIGLAYAALTQYDSAFVMYHFAYEHADTLEKTNTAPQIKIAQRYKAKINGNMGTSLNAMGQYPKAISYFSKALKIFEQLHDTIAIGQTYSNMGDIYFDIRKYDRAREAYSEAAQLIKNKPGRDNQLNYAKALSGMGAASRAEHKYTSALDLQLKSKKIREYYNSGFDIALSCNALGVFYGLLPDSACKTFNLTPQQKNDSALYYDKLSLAKFRAFKRKREECNALLTIGNVYVQLKDFKNAKLYYLKGDSLIRSMTKPDLKLLKDFYFSMSEFYRVQENYEQAFTYLTSWKTYNDSMNIKESGDQVNQLYAIELAERKVYGDSIRNATINKIKDETIKKQNRFQEILTTVLSSTLFILLVISAILIILSRRRKLLIGTTQELKEEFTPLFRQLDSLERALDSYSRRQNEEEVKISPSELNKWKKEFNQECNLHIKFFEQGLLIKANDARKRMRNGAGVLREMLIQTNNPAIRGLIKEFENRLENALAKFEDTESKALKRRRTLIISQSLLVALQILLLLIGGLVQYISGEQSVSLFFGYASLIPGILSPVVSIITLKNEPFKIPETK